MNRQRLSFMLGFALLLPSCGEKPVDPEHIVANPIDINYRFRVEDNNGRLSYGREAADPVLEVFKGKYYLAASKSGGYWTSDDLCHWKYIKISTLTKPEQYAPCLLAMGDTLYLGFNNKPFIFEKNGTPEEDTWSPADSDYPHWAADPDLFLDDDGELYLYSGCSNTDNIKVAHLDPDKGFSPYNGEEAVNVIFHNHDIYGWEVRGENNDDDSGAAWNEGPAMLKYNGTYYLQYASPGTEFRTYGDGYYTSDSPMGPFTYGENSPFCFKPGGFIAGAGHGDTVLDKYGNYWHVATMRISQRFDFERRLAIFPAWFGEDGKLYANTVLTDYPFYIPQSRIDNPDQLVTPGWNILQYGKAVDASSHSEGHDAEYAINEHVEDWWAAESGDAGEWLKVDLGKKMKICALQVNFADEGCEFETGDTYIYQYIIQGSKDGKHWKMLSDLRKNKEDRPHRLIVLKRSAIARYIRITNTSDCPGKFSLFGFRVFGDGLGQAPEAVADCTVKRNPEDRRRILIEWPSVDSANGYIVRWGLDKDHMNSAWMVYGNKLEAGCFNVASHYCFSVEAFNENGRSEASEIQYID